MATQIFSLINMTHHIQFFDQSAHKTNSTKNKRYIHVPHFGYSTDNKIICKISKVTDVIKYV